MLVGLSPLVLSPGADMLGFEYPPALQSGLALFIIVFGLWLITRAMQRARGGEPAVAVIGGELHLHVHPGRQIVLRRADIVAVEPMEEIQGFGPRLLHGSQGFRIITTTSGAQAVNLVICDRMVADPLEKVRATVEQFAMAS